MILYLLLPVKEFNDWYHLLEVTKQKMQEATEVCNFAHAQDNSHFIYTKQSSLHMAVLLKMKKPLEQKPIYKIGYIQSTLNM